ncbi:aarf domain containing kinase 2 [Perkinsela sp. CCAP 1560/4]|nr:aarf domain containing kinase 2 [Perkinsela sp. CCAP 1560/4]|eukprot:KNH07110.1 aarf domain containing kinase 2 [Perkinsela sp. CCAP 1560/4]
MLFAKVKSFTILSRYCDQLKVSIGRTSRYQNVTKFVCVTTGTATLLFGTHLAVRRFYPKVSGSVDESRHPYIAGRAHHEHLSKAAFSYRMWNYFTGISRFVAFLALILYIVVVLQLGLNTTHINRAIILIEHLGPLYVKLCQWASTRTDLIDERIISALQHTTTRSLIHSYETTLQVLQEEKLLGTKIDFVEPAIVGSGSAAQVHCAQYIPTGEKVAIKVLHPQSEAAYLHDLDFFLAVSWLLDHFYGYARFHDSALEFRQFMLSQFDMVHEAHNLKRFSRNFSGMRDVSFPKVFLDATTTRILTQEYVEGTLLSELFESQDLMQSFSSTERKTLANLGARAFFKMIFTDNFIHGDLHPGNIIIRKENQSSVMRTLADHLPLLSYLIKSKHSMVFVDCGLAFQLSEKEEKNFIDLFYAISRGKFYDAAELFLKRAPYSNCPNEEEYKTEMVDVLRRLDPRNNDLRNINFGSQFRQIWSILNAHCIGIESKFTSLFSSIAVVEGIGKGLDENLNFTLISLPFLVKRIPCDSTLLTFLSS